MVEEYRLSIPPDDPASFNQFILEELGRLERSIRSIASVPPAYFSGLSGVVADLTTEATAAATKGVMIVPDENITVTHIQAVLDPDNASDTYRGVIVQMSDETPSAVPVSSLGTTQEGNFDAGGAGLGFIQMPYMVPVQLTSGTPYFVGVQDLNSKTLALSVSYSIIMNAPVRTLPGVFGYNTTVIGSGAFDLSSTAARPVVAIRGAFDS